ncbi:MAG: hypothetical protein LBR27_06155 [Bifidobacteriaceae bacterium]|nr:hypothetical protein [Bifidobacteriaceae bacterium]
MTSPISTASSAHVPTTPASEATRLVLTVGETERPATLEDNSSAQALWDLLAQGPIEIAMEDYGSMEKVGQLPQTLPRNDHQFTTEPGDLVLYQGTAFVIYYAPNTWNFTKLGHIDGLTQADLLAVLGDGGVTVTLSAGS